MEQQILDKPEFIGGYGGYGGQPRSNEMRGKTALVILGVVFLFSVVGLLFLYMLYEELNNRIVNGFYSESNSRINYVRYFAILSIVTIIIRIVSIVFFIMWFRRAYFNLNQYGKRTTFTDGWAAGAWFVPFLNFVRPFQIMRDIWEDYIALARDENNPSDGIQSTALIWTWWILYWASWLISKIGNSMSNTINGYEVVLFSGIIELISLLCLMIVVNTIIKRETRVFNRVSAQV